MVFTGIPVFLDPPNWQQDHHEHGGGNGNGHGHGVGGGSTHIADNSPLSNMLHPSTQEMISAGVNSGLTPSSRPTLMADRARLAKIQPDMSLKCPRCDSNNTKFCYYNNYSLSQPRHFCKTCRRYWTKGGALRNVPVGGGCRRNKRNKSGGSNSNSSRSAAMDTTSSGSATMISTSNCTADQLLGIDNNPANQSTMHHHHILPFMPAIHSLSDYSVNVTGGGGGTDHHIGLTNFPSGRDFMSLTGGGGAASALGLDFSVGNEPVDQGQWRMQQHYSLMTLPPPQPRAESSGGGHQLLSMEPQALFPYEGDHHNNNHHQGLVEQPYMPVSAGIAAQLQLRAKPAGLIGNLCVNTAPSSSVMKMEGDHHQINHNNNPSQNLAFWTSNAWADFAANFPSTTSPLL